RQIPNIVRPILEGVAYLHVLEIVHRDLKPENLLFNDKYKILKSKKSVFDCEHLDLIDKMLIYDTLKKITAKEVLKRFLFKSSKIEDFTKQVNTHLSNKVIRTPLAPSETFSDDPLRILRCIRFASRFGFKNALKTKVSHERIGIELDNAKNHLTTLIKLPLEHINNNTTIHQCHNNNKLLTKFRYQSYTVVTNTNNSVRNNLTRKSIITCVSNNREGKRPIFSSKREIESMATTTEIRLTEEENKLIDLLKEVTEYMKKECPELPHVQLRIAGGWVRDKLLGYECADLDVAIDKMMGVKFAEQVINYLVKFKDYDEKFTRFHKIDVNPQKSKHLETATTKIFNYMIDFVNLRKESYGELTRTPTSISLGTPEEDAFRRDITINALFYNIHTKEIEDFTKQVNTHLSNKVIRTPLAPSETFSDDPLRILRCIRFASRFGFKNALKTKVSHERIGIELDKMIKGPDPTYSIQLINQMNLYNTIFYSPPGISSGTKKNPDISIQLYIRSLYLAAYLFPFKDLMYKEKSKEKPVIYYLIHECLKQRNLDAKETERIFLAIDPITDALRKNFNTPLTRSSLGMLICDYANSEWRKILVFVFAIELLSKFKELEMGEGPDIKKVLRSVMEWQLENPEGTPEECKQFILQ
ncbi:18631_t:CDS:10, partial [Entrophospora sp. SA101]